MNDLAKNCYWSLCVVLLLWAIHITGWFIPFDIRSLGIHPREFMGLFGIFLAPFIHAGLGHLSANSLALFVLLTIAITHDRVMAMSAIIKIVIIAGLGTWVFGSGSVHVGASSVILGLMGYLLLIGYYQKDWRSIMASVLVFSMYGAAFLFAMVPTSGVSWTGHFFGFIGGMYAVKSIKK